MTIEISIGFFSLLMAVGPSDNVDKLSPPPEVQKQAASSLPPQMPIFFESVKKLQPFMISDQAFGDPRNEKSIQDELNRLRDGSKNLPHQKELDDPFLKRAASNLEVHLNELAEAFSISKTYSRYLLGATLDGCGSCHGQIQGNKKHFLSLNSNDLKGTSFQKAEFLYMTRQYDEALKFYKEVLNENSTSIKMESFKRGLVIYLRQWMDLEKAEAWIKAFPIRHDDEKPQIDAYLSQLGQLKALQLVNPEKATISEIENFAEKTLKNANPDDLPKRLYLSGLLHAFELEQHRKGQDVSSDIYYWMGQTDKVLKSHFVFSLVSDYFEECIKVSPRSKRASQCFQELEKEVLSSYSSGSEVEVPQTQAARLNLLRKKMGLKSKKY